MATLVVAFDERGLGNDNVDYTLSADATAFTRALTAAASTAGGQQGGVRGQVSGGGCSKRRTGGRGESHRGAALARASRAERSTPVLAAVTYTNIVLTDTTNGVSTDVADVSRFLRRLSAGTRVADASGCGEPVWAWSPERVPPPRVAPITGPASRAPSNLGERLARSFVDCSGSR